MTQAKSTPRGLSESTQQMLASSNLSSGSILNSYLSNLITSSSLLWCFWCSVYHPCNRYFSRSVCFWFAADWLPGQHFPTFHVQAKWEQLALFVGALWLKIILKCLFNDFRKITCVEITPDHRCGSYSYSGAMSANWSGMAFLSCNPPLGYEHSLWWPVPKCQNHLYRPASHPKQGWLRSPNRSDIFYFFFLNLFILYPFKASCLLPIFVLVKQTICCRKC